MTVSFIISYQDSKSSLIKIILMCIPTPFTALATCYREQSDFNDDCVSLFLIKLERTDKHR